MQLIVLKMDVIMDEMLLKLCAGCVMNNLGSPDIGETKFQQYEKKNSHTSSTLFISGNIKQIKQIEEKNLGLLLIMIHFLLFIIFV